MPRNSKKKNNNKKKKQGSSGSGRPKAKTGDDGPAPAVAATAPTSTGPAAVGDGGGGPFWSLSSSSPATTLANAIPTTSDAVPNVTAALAAPSPPDTETPSAPPKGGDGEKSGTDDVNRPTSAADDTPKPGTAGTKAATQVKSTAPPTGSASTRDTPKTTEKTAGDNKQEKDPASSVGAMHVHDDDAAARKLRRANILDMTADKSDRSNDDGVESKGKADIKDIQTKSTFKEVPEKQQRSSQRMPEASVAASFMDDLEAYATASSRRRRGHEDENEKAASQPLLKVSNTTRNSDVIVKSKAAAAGVTATATRPTVEKMVGPPPSKKEASRMEPGDQHKAHNQPCSNEKVVAGVADGPNSQASKVASDSTTTNNTGITTATTPTPQSRPPSDAASPTMQPRRAVSTPVGAFQMAGANNRNQPPRRNTEFYANNTRPSILNEFDNLAQPSTEFRTSVSVRNSNDDSARRASKIGDKNAGEHQHDGHVVVPEATLVEDKELAKAAGNVDGNGDMLQLTKEEFEQQLQTKLKETISNQVVAEATKMEEGEVGSGDHHPNNKANAFTNFILFVGVSIVLIIVVVVAVSATRGKDSGRGKSSPITYNELRYEELKSLLVEELYPNYLELDDENGSKDASLGLAPLDDPSTPQFHAFYWLLNEDDAEFVDSLLFSPSEAGTTVSPSASPVSNETDDGSGNSGDTTDPSTALITSNINSTMITISINETDGTTSIQLGEDANGISGSTVVDDNGVSVTLDPRVVILERYLAALLYFTTTSNDDHKKRKGNEDEGESDGWLRPGLALNVGIPTCEWNTASTTEQSAMGFFCNGVNDAYVSEIFLGVWVRHRLVLAHILHVKWYYNKA